MSVNSERPDEGELRECAEALVSKWDSMGGVSEPTYWAIAPSINAIEKWLQQASETGSHVHKVTTDGNATAAADAEAILRVTEIIMEGKDRLIAAFREYAEMEALVDSGDAAPDVVQRAKRMRDVLLQAW